MAGPASLVHVMRQLPTNHDDDGERLHSIHESQSDQTVDDYYRGRCPLVLG
jgi:hypothetical protein